MRTINKVILIGHAGMDPDLRETASSYPVAHWSMATNRSVRVEGELQRRTDWHRCEAYGKLAELVGQAVRKGSRIYVEGHLEYGSFERDEGVQIPTCTVVCDEVVFLDRREVRSG